MARPLEEVQREYQAQSAVLGHAIYQMSQLELDCSRMRRRMRELNKEAQRASAKHSEPEQPSASEVQSVDEN